jgi:putative transposase
VAPEQPYFPSKINPLVTASDLPFRNSPRCDGEFAQPFAGANRCERAVCLTEAQIISMTKEQGAGMPTAEVCGKHGLSQDKFYKFKSKYGGMKVFDAAKLGTSSAREAKAYTQVTFFSTMKRPTLLPPVASCVQAPIEHASLYSLSDRIVPLTWCNAIEFLEVTYSKAKSIRIKRCLHVSERVLDRRQAAKLGLSFIYAAISSGEKRAQLPN